MCQHHLSAAGHRHTPFEYGAGSAGTKSSSTDYLAARLFPNGGSLEQAASLSFRFSALDWTNADAGLATNPGTSRVLLVSRKCPGARSGRKESRQFNVSRDLRL